MVEVFYGRRQAEPVDALLHGGNAIGHAVFRCRDAGEYERTRRELACFDFLA